MGLKHGVSLKQQKKDYKEQLDTMEGLLFKYSKHNTTEVGLKKMSKELNLPLNVIYTFWVNNISALLKMKVIKNDNMNGWSISRME